MTEITRVPLQPIAKGSLLKIWLGVIVAVLLGAGLAWAAVPKGFSIETIQEGSGPLPQEGDMVFVQYIGTFADSGEEFDRSQGSPLPIPGIFPDGAPFPIEEGASIEGFYMGLKQVQKGGKYKLYIPADLAYGDEPPAGAPIPPGADLVFEIEVMDIMSRETFDRNLMILQQQMQSQMGLPAGPEGGAAPGAPTEAAPGQ